MSHLRRGKIIEIRGVINNLSEPLLPFTSIDQAGHKCVCEAPLVWHTKNTSHGNAYNEATFVWLSAMSFNRILFLTIFINNLEISTAFHSFM